MSDEIPALRRLGPDVGDPKDAQSVAYVHPDLEKLVMVAIARYPGSGFSPESGEVHGLAAVTAITAVEKWLLERQPPSIPLDSPVLVELVAAVEHTIVNGWYGGLPPVAHVASARYALAAARAAGVAP